MRCFIFQPARSMYINANFRQPLKWETIVEGRVLNFVENIRRLSSNLAACVGRWATLTQNAPPRHTRLQLLDSSSSQVLCGPVISPRAFTVHFSKQCQCGECKYVWENLLRSICWHRWAVIEKAPLQARCWRLVRDGCYTQTNLLSWRRVLNVWLKALVAAFRFLPLTRGLHWFSSKCYRCIFWWNVVEHKLCRQHFRGGHESRLPQAKTNQPPAILMHHSQCH